jgi:hypothetical protein
MKPPALTVVRQTILNKENPPMLINLAFLILSLLAAGLFAYLVVGIVIYLHELRRASGVELKSHPSV